MDQMPNCPKCQSEYVYHDSINFVCPDCGNEWDNNEIQESDDDQLIVKRQQWEFACRRRQCTFD